MVSTVNEQIKAALRNSYSGLVTWDSEEIGQSTNEWIA